MASQQYDPLRIRISDDLAQALWAAMHDDDDLAADYVELCVIHGLSHLVEDYSAAWYTPEKWARIHEYLERARRSARTGEEGMVARFHAYSEPPF
jgi:hypothetical protein